MCLCGEGVVVDGLIREFGKSKVAGNTKEDLDIGKDEETLYENDQTRQGECAHACKTPYKCVEKQCNKGNSLAAI